jgi:hypothetical protein
LRNFGKPKGLLQVLWERRIVNETRHSEYTINRRQNEYSIVDKTFALKSLMVSCLDFEEEEKLLQSMERSWEFVGEGIKYSWGCAKLVCINTLHSVYT